MRYLRLFLMALIVVLLFSAPMTASSQRIRPPDAIKCDRNNLTSFTGRVLLLTRKAGNTIIRMRTDENTTERFIIRHPGTNDPTPFFLLRTEPFKKDNWILIEVRKNVVKPKMRATVWVCNDGSNPIVDWQPPGPDSIN